MVRPGTKLYLNSTSGHGIKAKDYIYIKGGVINMEIAADGAKGLNCDSLIYIAGGRTTIINSGTTEFGTDSLGNEETTGAAGMKADYNITMTGGTLNIKCTGDDAKGVNVAILPTANQKRAKETAAIVAELVANESVRRNLMLNYVRFRHAKIARDDFAASCALNGRAMDVNGTLTVEPGYTTFNDSNYHLFEVAY